MEEGFKVPFKLNAISTVQFASFPEVKVNEDDITLETGLKFGKNEQERLISVFAQVKFACSTTIFLTIEVGCEFEVMEEQFSSFSKPQGLTVPKALISHFAVITLGTARGALHAKTEGTIFNHYILPTINVTDLITDDLVFLEAAQEQQDQ